MRNEPTQYQLVLWTPLVQDMEGFRYKLHKTYGWDLLFVERVITEYKKFLYLGLTHQVAPSWEIDMVFHLHILYTKDYEFWCKEILRKTFHHNPEPLVSEPTRKKRNIYWETKEIYIQTFIDYPPEDIWTEWRKRDDVLIDLNEYVIVKKNDFKTLIKLFWKWI